MPAQFNKIRYRIVHVTSQEKGNAAEELYNHGVAVKGWATQRFCNWPQELVIQFEGPSTVHRIKLLSHQYKIATRVDLYIGSQTPNSAGTSTTDVSPTHSTDSPLNWKTAFYKRLGYFTLSSNQQTAYKARELKSVHVNCTGLFLKLVFHSCYSNPFNVYSQASVIALCVIGDPLAASSPVVEPQESEQALKAIDSITAQKIEQLNAVKERSVGNEELHNKLSSLIFHLQEMGERIAQKEAAKQAAVEQENYLQAQQLKVEIDKMREVLYSKIPQFPEETYEYNSRDLSIDSSCTNSAKRDIQERGVQPSSDLNQPAVCKEEPPFSRKPVAHSIKSRKAVSEQSISAEKAPSPTNSQKSPKSPHTLQLPAIPAANAYNEDRPLPALMRKAKPNNVGIVSQQQNLDEKEPNDVATEPETPEQNVETTDKELPPPSPLSPGHQNEAQTAVEVFGDYIVQCVYSRNRSLRELGIKEAQTHLSSPVNPADDETIVKACLLLISRTIEDRIPNVFLATQTLLECLLDQFAQKLPLKRKHVVDSISGFLTVITAKLADGNQRLRDSSSQMLLLLARSVLGPQIICNALMKAPRNVTMGARSWSQRLLLLTTLTFEFQMNIDEKSFNFLTAALEQTSSEVRSQAIKLVVEFYKVNPAKAMENFSTLRSQLLALIQAAISEATGEQANGLPASAAPRTGNKAARRSSQEPKSRSSTSSRPYTNASTASKPASQKEPIKIADGKDSSSRGQGRREWSQNPVSEKENTEFPIVQVRNSGGMPSKIPHITEHRYSMDEPGDGEQGDPTNDQLPPLYKTDTTNSSEISTISATEVEVQPGVPPFPPSPKPRKSSAREFPDQDPAVPLEPALLKPNNNTLDTTISSSIADDEPIGHKEDSTYDLDNTAEEFIANGPVEASPHLGAKDQHESILTQDEIKATDSLFEEVPSERCQFCNKEDPAFAEEGFESHYMNDCPMLTECKLCGQVVEIAAMDEHLLSECDLAHVKCGKCGRPTTRGGQSKTHTCKADKNSEYCPLCDEKVCDSDKKDSDPGEYSAIWSAHLYLCKKNTRVAAPTGT